MAELRRLRQLLNVLERKAAVKILKKRTLQIVKRLILTMGFILGTLTFLYNYKFSCDGSSALMKLVVSGAFILLYSTYVGYASMKEVGVYMLRLSPDGDRNFGGVLKLDGIMQREEEQSFEIGWGYLRFTRSEFVVLSGFLGVSYAAYLGYMITKACSAHQPSVLS